ncbi:hypothetical protein [Streptomyces sp. NPDC056672]|uniref:hypothetical protein n=1 Tax=Streptomyces sp. NPDC056672 TaxID=3345906 RepID=UPI0036A093F8
MGDRREWRGRDVGPGRERWEPEERELRVLLERAVPRLPAPEGRLRQVRERAVRTGRRRRTAGAAAAAVTGLVLAGALLPDALSGGSEAVWPAAPVPSVTTRDNAPDSRVGFSEVAGLILRLPEHWQALQTPADLGHEAQARGFASSQRLTAYEQPCPAQGLDLGTDPGGRDCLPVRALQRGGALLILVPRTDSYLARKIQQPPVLYRSDDPSPSCRKIHGTTEYSGLLGGTGAPYTAVSVSLCVAGDAPATVADVRAMITGAEFATTGVPAAPTSAAPAGPATPAGSAAPATTKHP